MIKVLFVPEEKEGGLKLPSFISLGNNHSPDKMTGLR